MQNRKQSTAGTATHCGILFIAICGMLLVACAATVPPVRSLPTHIKRIYIREFKNSSRLFGAQADLTLAVNDEFMSDGRLDVVQNDRADVRLEGRIKSFREINSALSGDRFPLVTAAEMVCVVELWDPYDPDRLVPISRFTVPAVVSYFSDHRYSVAEMDVEARDRLYRQMAKNIVHAVIAGAPEAPYPVEQAATQRYQERRSPQQYEPVLTEPRFPKPTPTTAE